MFVSALACHFLTLVPVGLVGDLTLPTRRAMKIMTASTKCAADLTAGHPGPGESHVSSLQDVVGNKRSTVAKVIYLAITAVWGSMPTGVSSQLRPTGPGQLASEGSTGTVGCPIRSSSIGR